MLDANQSCLIVVDVQGKLAQLMYDKETLFKNIEILIRAAKILGVPIIWCQQYPQGLGPTVEKIAKLLEDNEPIDKVSFDCLGDEKFRVKLQSLKKNNVILCGIETHICIYQTAKSLLKENYQVELISDAVSSRTSQNKQIAIDRMRSEGANISSTEMVLFELLPDAKDPKFKEIARLIK
ncbi:MAG: isochorismatase family protein [Planctomycetes bacterium]|nr:isochorismatase family protein [Planctomycetota bacterium]